MTAYQRFVRPVLAWLFVCLLAAVIMTIALLFVLTLGSGVQPSASGSMNGAGIVAAGFGLFIFMTIVAVSALPWMVIVWVVHLTAAPRGKALPLAGGLLGAVVWLLPVLTQSGAGDLGSGDLLAMVLSAAVGVAGGWIYMRVT